MKEWIEEFITQKNLVENSRKAYLYDLMQFEETISGQITEMKLKVYEQSLAQLKVSAQKRKISAVNQFLLYLYDQGRIERYYRIKQVRVLAPRASSVELLDLSFLHNPTENVAGQLVALLAFYLGLVPNEMMALKWTDLDLTYSIVRLSKGEEGRVLKIPEDLKPYLKPDSSQIYLFDHRGHSYSRQWLFNQLKAYLIEQGQANLTAQDLREQYILHEKEKGVDMVTLAKQLGLKSQVTLLKYYN